MHKNAGPVRAASSAGPGIEMIEELLDPLRSCARRIVVVGVLNMEDSLPQAEKKLGIRRTSLRRQLSSSWSEIVTGVEGLSSKKVKIFGSDE